MATSTISSMREEYEQNIPNNTKVRFHGTIMYNGEDTTHYVMIIPSPVPTSQFASVSCEVMRPAATPTSSDSSPTVTIENGCEISLSSQVNFSQYVGRLGIAELKFVYK